MTINIFQILGILSGAVALLAFVPYSISIFKNESKPHPISWILWAFMGAISLGTYWGTGARDTIYIAVINFLGPLITAFLSIKYWDWRVRFSKSEYACLLLSLISLFIWLGLKNPTIALTFNLVADLMAAIPTIRKTYKNPATEDKKTWFWFAIANLLSILAIQQWSYGIVLLPAYLFCFSTTIFVLSLRKTNFKIS